MIWVIFWLIIGTMWSWQAILEYPTLKKRHMSGGWKFFNIILNILILPIGVVFGIFAYVVGEKIKDEDKDIIDFEFTVLKIVTRYNELPNH